MEQRLAKGALIPEINLPDFNNQPLALSSLKGKYVLVLFWASSNQKSIEASKTFIGQYWRYKNVGFDVYHVCIDKSRDAWLKSHYCQWVSVAQCFRPQDVGVSGGCTLWN